jgi:PAS domain S-box-containing protein
MSSAKIIQTAGGWRPGRTAFSLWQRAVGFGAAWFLCAEVGSHLSARGGTFVSFWLPAGLLLAVLLLNRTRNWPWFLLMVLPVNFLFDLIHDPQKNPEIIFAFYCANMMQASTGAWLVRRFVAARPTLATLKEFTGLLGFAAVLSPMLGAIIGAATLVHFGLSPSFGQSWKIWWGSNAMAVLILTPFILVWFSGARRGTRNRIDSPKRMAEAVLLLLGLTGYGWYLLAYDQGIMASNKSIMIPFLLWAGLRFGPRWATAVMLLLALVISFFTSHFSIGLTPAQVSSGDYIFLLQTFLAMAALVALIPAIVSDERDRFLEETRESEERFKNLSAAAFEGICLSENGRILDVNSQFLAMFGYEKDSEVIGRPIVELVAPESRAMAEEAVSRGRETIYGHQLLRRDGSIFFAEAQAKMIRRDGRNVRMTALRDITSLKNAEEALRESEEKFSKAFQSNPNGICITEMATGRYIEMNESFCRLFGYSRAEMIGHTSIEMDIWEHPADRERLVRPLREGGVVNNVQVRTRDRNRQTKILLVSAEIIELGGRQCMVSMLHDMTEREAAIQREQQARTQYTFQLIASQEAERGRIARELHDSLGQNLLLIINRTQLELAKKGLPDDVRDQLQGIGDLAMLAIAETRQIAHDLHPPQLDYLGLTQSLTAMVESAGEASSFKLAGKFDEVDDVFSTEAAMSIYRIVQESLNNILKHSRAKNARATLERDIHEVLLKIEDDGCGFNVHENGKGLGLRNIAERVQMLGGKLKIDSQPGKGARIEIRIPISAEAG